MMCFSDLLDGMRYPADIGHWKAFLFGFEHGTAGNMAFQKAMLYPMFRTPSTELSGSAMIFRIMISICELLFW
jgi:hypothetical protein